MIERLSQEMSVTLVCKGYMVHQNFIYTWILLNKPINVTAQNLQTIRGKV